MTACHRPSEAGAISRFAPKPAIPRAIQQAGEWLDEVSDHVQQLMAEGRWMPRYETFPIYESPLPEFSKDH